MKKILLCLFVITLVSCTNQTPKLLTNTEKDSLIKEIKAIAILIRDACNNVDVQKFTGYFLDSPDFISISSDGLMVNYEQKIIDEKSFFESVSALHLTILNEDVKILDRSLVIYTVQFKLDATLKTGQKLSFDKLTAAEIFKKVDNQWKIALIQESGLPPTISGS